MQFLAHQPSLGRIEVVYGGDCDFWSYGIGSSLTARGIAYNVRVRSMRKLFWAAGGTKAQYYWYVW